MPATEPTIIPARVGFYAVEVPAGAATRLTFTTAVPFRGMHLWVPPAIASGFTLDRVLIEDAPQHAIQGPVLASQFSADGPEGSRVRLRTAPAHAAIHLVITNRMQTPSWFAAVLHGDVIVA